MLSRRMKILVLLCGVIPSSQVFGAESKAVTIQNVIDYVKSEIKYAQGVQTGRPLIKIGHVDLTLAVETKLQGQAGISGDVPVIGVGVDLGGSGNRDESSTYTLSFIPDGSVEVRAANEAEHKLANMILAVKEATLYATAGEPRFLLDNATIELGFDVSIDGDAKITFLFFEIGGGASKKNKHRIKLRFVPIV